MNAITASQTKRFWSVFSGACKSLGLTDKNDRENYRKEVLKTEGGVLHLRDLDRTSGFDKVMARLSMDSGDYSSAVKYAESTAFRLLAVLENKAREVASDGWESYVNAVRLNSRIGVTRHSLKDLTDAELRALIAILDTHIRRTKKRLSSS